MTSQEEAVVCWRYREGWTMAELSELFYWSEDTVRRVLIRNDVKVRRRGRRSAGYLGAVGPSPFPGRGVTSA